jgi:hypothetical protein
MTTPCQPWQDGEGSTTMTYRQKPSIFQLGKVHDNGPSVIVSGWGLGMCATSCSCHRNPEDGQLALAEDHTGGSLGLRCFADGGRCDCCEAWTSAELSAILRDVAALEALDASEPAAG